MPTVRRKTMLAEPNRADGVRHRAAYTLNHGVWWATCRVCGWAVTDPQRRQAATFFRGHIRESRLIDRPDPDDSTPADPVSEPTEGQTPPNLGGEIVLDDVGLLGAGPNPG
jgi:hypothetical protein